MPGERERAIRRRVAYAIWEEEGRPEGKDLDHWRRAARRTQYLATLGFSDGSEAAAKQSAAALARAYALRTFEIEHYWKRGAYFWAFQVAVFAALAFLFGTLGAAAAPHPIAFALAGLGILTALANFLTARGSKFWQQNWERHIDMLEDEAEGRLHKTVWLDEGKVSFSVSRINQWLSSYFVGFWIIVAVYVGWRSLGGLPVGLFSSARTYVPVLTILIALCAAGLWGQATELRASLPGSDGVHGSPVRRCRWSRRICAVGSQPFVRRYGPDEGPPSGQL